MEKLESTDVGDRERNTNSIASVVTIPIWYNFNIVESIPVKGGGLRYKKIFSLEDFGINVPKID